MGTIKLWTESPPWGNQDAKAKNSGVLNTVRHSSGDGSPLPAAKPEAEVKVSKGKTEHEVLCCFVLFRIRRCPLEEAGRLRKLAKGRATRFLLNWFGIFFFFFFFLVYGNDHIQGSLQARQMATFPAAVLPERSPLARRLHTFSNSVFPSCRQGPFLKLFCLAQTLFESGSNTSALNILRQQLQE